LVDLEGPVVLFAEVGCCRLVEEVVVVHRHTVVVEHFVVEVFYRGHH